MALILKQAGAAAMGRAPQHFQAMLEAQAIGAGIEKCGRAYDFA